MTPAPPPADAPPAPIGPFRGKISCQYDISSTTLTLPSDLRVLKIGCWSLIVSILVLQLFTSSSLAAAILLGTISLVIGFIIERSAVALAHAISRKSTTAWIILTLSLVLLTGLSMLIGLIVLLVVAPCLVMLYLLFVRLSGQTPTMQIGDRAITMERRRLLPTWSQLRARSGRVEKRVIPLDQIQRVDTQPRWALNPPAADVVMVLQSGENVTVWGGPLRSQERKWLSALIASRAQTRKEILHVEGHDLSKEATPPADLRALQDKV